MVSIGDVSDVIVSQEVETLSLSVHIYYSPGQGLLGHIFLSYIYIGYFKSDTYAYIIQYILFAHLYIHHLYKLYIQKQIIYTYTICVCKLYIHIQYAYYIYTYIICIHNYKCMHIIHI